MAKGKENTVSINYRLADGKQVPVDVSPEVARFLKSEEKRERTRRRDDRRFLDKDGYVDGETELLLHDLGESVLQEVEHKERAALVNGAIKRLRSRHRNYVHAYYFKGMTLQEIADIEGLNRATVGRVLQKAVAHLRAILQGDPDFSGYESMREDDG